MVLNPYILLGIHTHIYKFLYTCMYICTSSYSYICIIYPPVQKKMTLKTFSLQKYLQNFFFSFSSFTLNHLMHCYRGSQLLQIQRIILRVGSVLFTIDGCFNLAIIIVHLTHLVCYSCTHFAFYFKNCCFPFLELFLLLIPLPIFFLEQILWGNPSLFKLSHCRVGT